MRQIQFGHCSRMARVSPITGGRLIEARYYCIKAHQQMYAYTFYMGPDITVHEGVTSQYISSAACHHHELRTLRRHPRLADWRFKQSHNIFILFIYICYPLSFSSF